MESSWLSKYEQFCDDENGEEQRSVRWLMQLANCKSGKELLVLSHLHRVFSMKRSNIQRRERVWPPGEENAAARVCCVPPRQDGSLRLKRVEGERESFLEISGLGRGKKRLVIVLLRRGVQADSSDEVLDRPRGGPEIDRSFNRVYGDRGHDESRGEVPKPTLDAHRGVVAGRLSVVRKLTRLTAVRDEDGQGLRQILQQQERLGVECCPVDLVDGRRGVDDAGAGGQLEVLEGYQRKRFCVGVDQGVDELEKEDAGVGRVAAGEGLGLRASERLKKNSARWSKSLANASPLAP